MDLVLRATFAFVLVFLMTRLIGRRELGKFQAFDLILFIVIGDLVQQGITQSDYSVTGLLLAAGTVSLCAVGVSYASFRFRASARRRFASVASFPGWSLRNPSSLS